MSEELHYLRLDRCPHCNVAKPYLPTLWTWPPEEEWNRRSGYVWTVSQCSSCHRMILAHWHSQGGRLAVFPSQSELPEEIPPRARRALKEAIETTFAPGASIMVCAQSVDYMLKEKGYTKGDSLNIRIKNATEKGDLTPDMAKWADEVRLSANDERHKDTDPTPDDALHSIEFALALAQFLFVLPARIKKGLREASNVQS